LHVFGFNSDIIVTCPVYGAKPGSMALILKLRGCAVGVRVKNILFVYKPLNLPLSTETKQCQNRVCCVNLAFNILVMFEYCSLWCTASFVVEIHVKNTS
jgi:hypothetical protein